MFGADAGYINVAVGNLCLCCRSFRLTHLERSLTHLCRVISLPMRLHLLFILSPLLLAPAIPALAPPLNTTSLKLQPRSEFPFKKLQIGYRYEHYAHNKTYVWRSLWDPGDRCTVFADADNDAVSDLSRSAFLVLKGWGDRLL